MISRVAAWSMRRPRHHTLIFHRVLSDPDPMNPDEPTADWFRRLMAMLVTHFEPIALGEAVAQARSGALSGGTISVTFDDGYADNYLTALPILASFGVPATFFVASGFLDGGRMWNDTIIEVFRRLEVGEHDLDLPGIESPPLTDWASRRRAATATIAAWKHLPPDQRQANVDALADRVSGLPTDLMMSRAQLADLASQDRMTVGGHTRTHPILASIGPGQASDEIAVGKSELEDIIGAPLSLFAYPNGKHGRDYRDEHAAMVADAGFDAAVATDWGAMSASTDLFHIPRFTPWHIDLNRFSIDLARCHYGLI